MTACETDVDDEGTIDGDSGGIGGENTEKVGMSGTVQFSDVRVERAQHHPLVGASAGYRFGYDNGSIGGARGVWFKHDATLSE